MGAIEKVCWSSSSRAPAEPSLAKSYHLEKMGNDWKADNVNKVMGRGEAGARGLGSLVSLSVS